MRTDLHVSKLAEYEQHMLKTWEEEQLFQAALLAKRKKFVFYEGPPTANGKPGLHHLLARAVKDMVCRYKTMQGFHVARKAGWDTHGLPVELEVEKKLKLASKDEVEEYGVAEFNQACKDSVFAYLPEWEAFTRRMAYWLDMKNAYVTCSNEYVESVWHLLAELHEKNLLYQDYRVSLCCPRCVTPLSDHEVSDSYKDKRSQSAYVKFRAVTPETSGAVKSGDFFLAWTTTPWTLSANKALAVNPNLEYSRVHSGDSYYWVASNKVASLFPDGQVVALALGSVLARCHYESLLLNEDACGLSVASLRQVVCADFVNSTDGTGLVHVAPPYGVDDFNLAKQLSLKVEHTVLPNGDVVGTGTNYLEYEKKVLELLKERGYLLKTETVTHKYPHCWRCDTPLLFYARKSWFLKTSQFKNRMLELNKNVKWYPESTGQGRFQEWLKNNVDWAVSRDRYWGTPLPVWVCDRCSYEEAVPGRQALRERTKTVPDDLHRPFVDSVTWQCGCGGTMRRTPEVLDCWFDSGAMPFAQWGYPSDNGQVAENFPADFVAEGVDQTRGWFYTLLALSTILRDAAPYKSVLATDLVLDSKGKKMSKTRGNAVEPMALMEKYGADVVRWYLLTSRPVWQPLRFNEHDLTDARNKFFGTLLNVYQFYATYYELSHKSHTARAAFSPEEVFYDEWLLEQVNDLAKACTKAMEECDSATAGRLLTDFVVNDLSKWYVRHMRDRFASPVGNVHFQPLNAVLRTVCRLAAPMAPFFTDLLHRELSTRKFGVHLETWPKGDLCKLETSTLELPRADTSRTVQPKMAMLQNVVTSGLAARGAAKVKLRQPLNSVTVTCTEEQEYVLDVFRSVVLNELNVHALLFARGDFKVELDTTLTPELLREGQFRELTRQLQDFRKNVKCKVGDTVTLLWSATNPQVKSMLTEFSPALKNEWLTEMVEHPFDVADSAWQELVFGELSMYVKLPMPPIKRTI